jgi:hypothetical protein
VAGAAGIDCQVIAPSKTPRAAGDRNKSDRRETDLLLRQLMAGALTAIAVPSVTFEAARDLARACEQVRADLRRPLAQRAADRDRGGGDARRFLPLDNVYSVDRGRDPPRVASSRCRSPIVCSR